MGHGAATLTNYLSYGDQALNALKLFSVYTNTDDRHQIAVITLLQYAGREQSQGGWHVRQLRSVAKR